MNRKKKRLAALRMAEKHKRRDSLAVEGFTDRRPVRRPGDDEGREQKPRFVEIHFSTLVVISCPPNKQNMRKLVARHHCFQTFPFTITVVALFRYPACCKTLFLFYFDCLSLSLYHSSLSRGTNMFPSPSISLSLLHQILREWQKLLPACGLCRTQSTTSGSFGPSLWLWEDDRGEETQM